MTSFKEANCVIYDMDGLLLDTEPFYTEATQQIVSRFGIAYDWSIKSQLIGKTALDSARTLIQTLDLPLTPEEYLEERNVLLDQLCLSAQPLPGAKSLSQHLFKHNIPQAVASSSSRHSFELKTTHHREWFSLFDCVVLGDDPGIKKGKPAPDLFLKAAELLGADPKKCLVFEDAPSGMEAALAAGMSVVVVPDARMNKAVYRQAHQILHSLEEFDPEPWRLPAFSESNSE